MNLKNLFQKAFVGDNGMLVIEKREMKNIN